jgi:hypothetical protein
VPSPPAILKTESWIALPICDHIDLSRICDVVLTMAEIISTACVVCVVPTQEGKKWCAVKPVRSQELQEVPKEGKRGEGTWIKLGGEVDFNRTKLR